MAEWDEAARESPGRCPCCMYDAHPTNLAPAHRRWNALLADRDRLAEDAKRLRAALESASRTLANGEEMPPHTEDTYGMRAGVALKAINDALAPEGGA